MNFHQMRPGSSSSSTCLVWLGTSDSAITRSTSIHWLKISLRGLELLSKPSRTFPRNFWTYFVMRSRGRTYWVRAK